MDMKLTKKIEIWINGKYFFTADGLSFSIDRELKNPELVNDSTKKGHVIDLKKVVITEQENKKAEEESKKEYDAFFKKAVKERFQNKNNYFNW
jgi:hypothetical protein